MPRAKKEPVPAFVGCAGQVRNRTFRESHTLMSIENNVIVLAPRGVVDDRLRLRKPARKGGKK